MNLPNWSRLPNPDFRRLLQFLRREAPPGKIPFLVLSANLEVITCITRELLIVLEDGKNDREVRGRSG